MYRLLMQLFSTDRKEIEPRNYANEKWPETKFVFCFVFLHGGKRVGSIADNSDGTARLSG